MAIWRAEQARLSFAAESGHGGYMELIDTTTSASSGTTTLNGNHAAGSRSLTVAATTNFLVGEYVLIEAAGDPAAEIRRILRVDATNLQLFLDYPLGFNHLNTTVVVEQTNAFPTGSTYSTATSGGHPQGTAGDGGINFATFLPGVYETITTPDLTPEFLPQYFLKDSSDRNWSYMYRGKQTFNGSLPNFILLNGYALRFPFGGVRTVATAVSGASTTLNGATLKGAREIVVASGVGIADGEYIEIERGGTNPEVRQVVSGGGTTTLVLNYPCMFAHVPAPTITVSEVTVGTTFTHTMVESAELDSMTWNVLMRDSGETAANDFIRRYVGGMVNRATLSADEGEMLRFSWDDVQFLDLIHNQTRNSAVTGDGATADIMDKSSNMLLSPIGIGGDMSEDGSSLLAAPTYPTTEPYYFSQGTLSFMGVDFARVRNFSLEINNNIEARYYIRDQGGKRIPSEFQENNREYRLTMTVALPDSFSATAQTRSLWKELILEGNYAGTGTSALTGFTMVLTFTRGTSDTITITSPSSSASSAFDSQGCFFARASHEIGTESPIQVEGEVIMRNMLVVVVDSLATYP